MRYSNPDLGNGVLDVKSDEGNTIDFGGFRTASDPKAITSNGKLIRKMTNSRSAVKVKAADDDVNNTFRSMQQLAGSVQETTWTITHISGKTYTASMAIVGDVIKDMNEGTFDLQLEGTFINEI